MSASSRDDRTTGSADARPPDQPPPASTPQPRIADRADFDPAYDPDAPIVCEVCGGVMHYTSSCRILCANCGYTRDCADP